MENGFFDQVYAIVRCIPEGKVVSYGQIAKMLGRPRGARVVGWAMRKCPDDCPWQRVVRDDGTIAGGEMASLRQAMLVQEGVPFTRDGRVDMEKCRWTMEDAVPTDLYPVEEMLKSHEN
ncbi:MAG: MGMT family protein [Lachnospiraceae bacterium]|nr:MGMT family protein [Lachnospiraceae bacterium]